MRCAAPAVANPRTAALTSYRTRCRSQIATSLHLRVSVIVIPKFHWCRFAYSCSFYVTLKLISDMRILLLLLAIVAPCFGQAGKAELFGAIQDPSGLPVSTAKVQAEEQATMAHFDTTT